MSTHGQALSNSIITDISRYNDYPFEKLNEQVRTALCAATTSFPLYIQQTTPRLMKMFECFLQITAQEIGENIIYTNHFSLLCIGFLGAINSDKFISLSVRNRYTYSLTLLKLTESLGIRIAPFNADTIHLNSTKVSKDLQHLANKFNETELEKNAEWLWRGWPSKNKNDKNTSLPLYPFYSRYGREKTEILYEALNTWFSRGRAQKVPVLKIFIDFISNCPVLTDKQFQCRETMTVVWHNFWDHYQNNRKITCHSKTIIKDWVGGWVPLVEDTLITPTLFARPFGAFPGPDINNKPVEQNANNIDFDEILVELPSDYSDYNALEAYRDAIPKTLARITSWARGASGAFFERYKRRKKLSKIGIARALGATGVNNGQRQLVAKDNPNKLAHAAATYEQLGHKTRKEIPSLAIVYPQPLADTAYQLGLPVGNELFPYAALLVIHHPSITPSFLENLDLYSNNGKVIGLRKQNGFTYLVGFKYRAGKNRARQAVKLNHETLRLVWQILVITKPLRKYLREKASSDWKRLFISCGPAFGQPQAVKKFSSFSSDKYYVEDLKKSLLTFGCFTVDEAVNFSARMSLRTIRSLKGIDVFVATNSEVEMSKALGHKAAQPRLLERYLPAKIKNFFRERWIRTFQLRVTIEITKGGPYCLKATRFKSEEEIAKFMENHSFPNLALLVEETNFEQTAELGLNKHDGKAVFNLNLENITLMFRIKKMTHMQLSEKSKNAEAWINLSNSLIGYLEKRRGIEPTLDELVERAREAAKLFSIENIFSV